jgi:hypothetical protein
VYVSRTPTIDGQADRQVQYQPVPEYRRSGIARQEKPVKIKIKNKIQREPVPEYGRSGIARQEKLVSLNPNLNPNPNPNP